MCITSTAIAQSDGKIKLSGQLLAPAACRVDPTSIRTPDAIKLTCVTNARGVAQTPVQRVSIQALNTDATTYVVQISYL